MVIEQTHGHAPTPLKHPPFLIYWVARMASLLGDQVFMVSLAPVLLDLTRSSAGLGQYFSLYSAFQVAFLIVGGVVADRWPRRGVMTITDVVQAVSLAVVLVLWLEGRLEMLHLYGLAIVFGIASAFFMPASQSLLPEIVPKPMLVSANALSSLGMHAVGVVGPAVGGLLSAWGGPRLSFLVNAASFVLSAALLVGLRSFRHHSRPENPHSGIGDAHELPAHTTKPTVWQDLRGGFEVVRGIPWLWVSIAVFAVVNVFESGARWVLLPILSNERFGGSGAFGTLLSSLAVGAVVAGTVLSRVKTLRKRGWLGYGSFVVAGVCMVLLAKTNVFPVAVVLTFVIGMAHMVFGVIWPATIQELVPADAQGRVWSLDMIGSFGLLPLGFLFSGWFGHVAGTETAMVVSGVLIALFMVLGLCHPGVRHLD